MNNVLWIYIIFSIVYKQEGRRMKEKREVIYIGNNFVESSYKCSPTEKKILNMAILYTNRSSFPAKPNPHHTYFVNMEKNDIYYLTGLDTKKDFTQIKNACKALNEKVLMIEDSVTKKFKTSSFITQTELNKGVLTLGFYGTVVPFFNKLKERFTSYDLLQTKNFMGKYTIRFYELIKQYESIGKRTVLIADLRKMFQLENRYTTYSDLRRKVIEPAQKELKEKSDLYFELKQNTEKRKAVSVTLTIKLNAKHIDKKYYLKRVNDYLANQSVNDFYDDLRKYYHEHQESLSISEKQAINNFIFTKPDPKALSESLLYHFFQWYEPSLGL